MAAKERVGRMRAAGKIRGKVGEGKDLVGRHSWNGGSNGVGIPDDEKD